MNLNTSSDRSHLYGVKCVCAGRLVKLRFDKYGNCTDIKVVCTHYQLERYVITWSRRPVKTHHCIIFFAWPLHSKPGVEIFWYRLVQTNCNQVWPSCWLWGIVIMFRCVSSPSEFYILSCERSLGLRPQTFFTTKNVELIGFYPIHND